MPDLQPPELARLLDHAQRPRAGDWSLRAALVRYAQFRPGHVRDLMHLVRRLDDALHGHAKVLGRDGEALWAALRDGTALEGEGGRALALLRLAGELDRLADEVVAWAQDRAGPLPDQALEEVSARVARGLAAAGVGPQEPGRPPRRG